MCLTSLAKESGSLAAGDAIAATTQVMMFSLWDCPRHWRWLLALGILPIVSLARG